MSHRPMPRSAQPQSADGQYGRKSELVEQQGGLATAAPTPDEYCFTMDDDDSYPGSLYGGSDELDFGFDGDEEADIGFESISRSDGRRPQQDGIESTVFDSLDHAWDVIRTKARSITEVTNLPEPSAVQVLPVAKWDEDVAIEKMLDNSTGLLDKAGINDPDGTSEVSPSGSASYTCFIETECLDDEYNPIPLGAADVVFSKCGHTACKACLGRYLDISVNEGKWRLECPFHDCDRLVPTEALELMSPRITQKHHKLFFELFITESNTCKWCPAPGCEHIIRCHWSQKQLGRVPPIVTCSCKNSFCFNCYNPDHRPAPCEFVKMWLKKCKDDSETANWISANTKECPKCQSTIEKNGGCNHMTCRKCRYEFCWMCMGRWSEHGNSWYNCNRFEEKSGTEARDAQARSRQSLDRYLHYYNRYANHEQSAKLDKDFAAVTQEKMSQVQISSKLSWIEVQFLQDASDCLQLCRQTLKWTYAFAYYLKPGNQAEIFEDNQKDLEMAVESLSRMFEQAPEVLKDMKIDMVDKIAYCNRRRDVLLDDTATRLKISDCGDCGDCSVCSQQLRFRQEDEF